MHLEPERAFDKRGAAAHPEMSMSINAGAAEAEEGRPAAKLALQLADAQEAATTLCTL